jgi:hypothetical protein
VLASFPSAPQTSLPKMSGATLVESLGCTLMELVGYFLSKLAFENLLLFIQPILTQKKLILTHLIPICMFVLSW